jgi:ribonucleoside-diphosphate reductase alpha chain
MQTTITQIKKRSGEVVEFDPKKIHTAITKAFIAVTGVNNELVIKEINEGVLKELDTFFQDRVPGVEDIQNAVERKLMERGLFDVAKDYIIYRYEHTKVREEKKQEVLRKIEESSIMVKKRNGSREVFSLDKVRSSLDKLLGEYKAQIDVEMILDQIRLEVYEDMSTTEIERALVMVLRSHIEKDPAYSYVAARALLSKIYKQVVGPDTIDFNNLEESVRKGFITTIQTGV